MSFSSQLILIAEFLHHDMDFLLLLILLLRLIGRRANKLKGQILWPHSVTLVIKFYV